MIVQLSSNHTALPSKISHKHTITTNMCQQEIFHFQCECPHRDTPRCPHHEHIRIITDINSADKRPDLTTSGFYRRQPREAQRHAEWEPIIKTPRWVHCSVYKKAKMTCSPKQCPERQQSPEKFTVITQHMHGLCDHCSTGHRGYRPGQVSSRGSYAISTRFTGAHELADEIHAATQRRIDEADVRTVRGGLLDDLSINMPSPSLSSLVQQPRTPSTPSRSPAPAGRLAAISAQARNLASYASSILLDSATRKGVARRVANHAANTLLGMVLGIPGESWCDDYEHTHGEPTAGEDPEDYWGIDEEESELVGRSEVLNMEVEMDKEGKPSDDVDVKDWEEDLLDCLRQAVKALGRIRFDSVEEGLDFVVRYINAYLELFWV